MRKRNFTIIELLVVIAIIVLLASLLLPALSRAKSTAVKLQCANKIKQLGAQCLVYSDDFDGLIIASNARFKVPMSSLSVYWFNYINYFYYNDKVWHTSVNPSVNLICPVDTAPHPYQGTILSYGFNAHIMSGITVNRLKMRVAELRSPSLTYMLSDTTDTNRYYLGTTGLPYLRLEHNKSTSMFYVDGHIGNLREQPPTLSVDPPWCIK